MESILWFIGILVCLYFGTFWGLFFWAKKQGEDFSRRLPAAVAGFLVAMFMTGLAACHFLFAAPKLTAYTMIGVVLVALLFLAAKWPEKKKIWLPLMCIGGTYIVHRMIPDMPLDYMTYGLMSVVWMAVMAVVMFLDRLPLLSFFTMATWAFAFATVVFLEGVMPPMLAIGCWLVLVPLWATIRVSAEEMKGSLGVFGSSFLGFMMGGVIAVCVGLHAYNSALSLTSYYLFEMLMFGLAWFGFHPMGMQKGEFAYMIALQKGNSARIIKVLFYHLMVLSLIAVLTWNSKYNWTILLVIAIVLLDLYNRYKLFGQQGPSVRQLWRDTKAGLKELWHHKDFLKKTDKPEGKITNDKKINRDVQEKDRQVKRKKKK